MLPEMGWPTIYQAEILREWNQLDTALELVEKAIALCKETISIISLPHLLSGYAILLRICLSRTELDLACSTLQQFERTGQNMNPHIYLYMRSLFTTIDQVRLWLACGELERATLWAEKLDMTEQHSTPFAREREEVACARILLATGQPSLAIKRLEPVLQRATAGQRWGHVIEVRILQALANRMCDKKMQALDALSEAVRLAEPEGYLRSFVDEGTSMQALFYQLRRQERKQGPTPYLDSVIAAFQQESRMHTSMKETTKTQRLPNPLSKRELQVLHLLGHGTSNQEIAQELVITIDTVKRHISHIFAKLGVQNRVQAVKQAQKLGLLDEED